MNHWLDYFYLTLSITICVSIFIYLFKESILNLWDYFFNKWEVTIKEAGEETWTTSDGSVWGGRRKYGRTFVIYLYKHKFNKQEKLVKEYLN